MTHYWNHGCFLADGEVLARVGRNSSKPKAHLDHQLLMAMQMLSAPDTSMLQVAEHFGVARSTLYQLLEKTPSKVAAEDTA